VLRLPQKKRLNSHLTHLHTSGINLKMASQFFMRFFLCSLSLSFSPRACFYFIFCVLADIFLRSFGSLPHSKRSFIQRKCYFLFGSCIFERNFRMSINICVKYAKTDEDEERPTTGVDRPQCFIQYQAKKSHQICSIIIK
jgi:hypothetical protein